MNIWQSGKTYRFCPSGDAEVLELRVLGTVPLNEAIAWYETTYERPFDIDAAKAWRAVITKGGRDGNIRHKRDDTYYVFDTEFDNDFVDVVGQVSTQ